MTQPQRIERKRTKGWRKPEGAICVTRLSRRDPGPWGNPFRIGDAYRVDHKAQRLDFCSPDERGHDGVTVRDAAHAVELYRVWLAWGLEAHPDLLEPLRGHDLACWCPVGEPCHADVLLELANPPRRAITIQGAPPMLPPKLLKRS